MIHGIAICAAIIRTTVANSNTESDCEATPAALSSP